MPPGREHPEPVQSELPKGAPPWVTPELVAHTLKVWGPRHAAHGIRLIAEDALDIIVRVGRLIDLLTGRPS